MFTAIYKTVQNALSSDSPTHDDDSTDGSRSDSDIPSYPALQISYDDSSSEFEAADVEVKNINGKVTKLLSGYGLIDEEIYFSFDSVLTQFRPKVGDRVSAIVYRDRKGSGWRAKQVNVESTEWGTDDDDGPEDMIGIITKATKIETVINDVLQCTHDSIVQGYRPYSGDWVQACTYKDPETGTTLVKDVHPLREQKIYGRITHVYVGYGFIDDRTYFAFSACECGYAPHKGDRVVARCIESKQKRGNWRAISVELKREKQLPRPEDLVVGPLQLMKADLMKDKCGMMITDKLDFGLVTTGKTKKINFWIRNVGIGLQVLKNVSVCNLHSQITIDFPGVTRKDENKKEEDDSPPHFASLMILPGCASQGTITVKTENLGKFRELVTFDFGSFEIGRHVYMEVLDEKIKLLRSHGDASYRHGNLLQKYKDQYFHSQTGMSVHGVRPTRMRNWNTPVKLKKHPVPDELVQCVLEKRELTSFIPELLQSLCIENYFTRFSTLLHLEEIQMEIDIRKYDIERESLRHRGEYLVLSVDGLAEGRPSVLVGDRIILTPIDAPSNTVNYEGYVHEVYGEEVLLKFHPSFHDDYVAEEYHITFTFSKTVLQRCHQAADMAVIIGNRILFPTAKVIEVKPPQISITFPESQQPIKPTFKKTMIIPRVAAPARARRGVVPNQDYLPRKTPSGGCQFIVPKIATSVRQTSAKRGDGKVVGEYFDKKLNARQKIAVFRILQGQTRPTPYILFGPPGTGKTVTVVESILQVHHHVKSSRILACTPSNSAADLLTCRLANSGRVKQNDLVRLNSFRRSEENIDESIKPYCTDGQMLEIVVHHRIIICTCSTAGSFFQLKLRPGHFTHIFVDEAGQATEPECLIPVALAKGDDSQIILAGDPMQLGPVLQSRLAIKLGFNQSLLERLMQRPVYRRDEKKFRDHGSYDPLLVTKLVNNYRSHECILHIPSNLFYHNDLVVKADVQIREKFKSWELLPNKNFPMIFHGIQGEELQEGNSPSWFNPAEAVQSIKYLQALLQQSDQTVTVTDCGIITPYRKQVEKIHVLLRSVDIDGVKVGSVEEFQGQEKPVIIISTVRSGEEYIGFDLRHKLGFLSNPKRFNVSVTRAQGLLIIVGNPNVLAKDPKWLAMLTYCVRNNAYVGCELPDLDGQDEMELIRLEKSFYDMPSDGEQEKEDINSKEEQADDGKMQIKEGVKDQKDGQGVMELIRLEKSFCDMPSVAEQEKEEDIDSKEEQADGEKMQIMEDVKHQKDGQDEMELIRFDNSFHDMPSDEVQEKEEDINSKEEQADDEKMQIKEDVKDQKDGQDEVELIRFENSFHDMPSDEVQEKEEDINSKEEQADDEKIQIKEDVKDQKDGQGEMELIRFEKSFYDMPSDGRQEKEGDINSKEKQADDEKMQIKEDVKDLQDEMELGRLKKSLYDMPSDDEQEKKEDFSSKEEQADDEKVQIKEDVKAEKGQSLPDLLRALGILDGSEKEDKTSGTGNISLICSDVSQKSEVTGIKSIADEENASESNLLMHNKQDMNNVAGAISCNLLDFASTKCEGTGLMWELDNITKDHEHQHGTELSSSSCNSSHLLDVVSHEQKVYQETGYLTSSDDPGVGQIDVCLKELKDGTAAAGSTDDNDLNPKDHRDNQNIKNADKFLLKPGYRRVVDSKRTTLEGDYRLNECDRNEKGKESSMTTQSRDTSSANSMDEDFEKIISNLVDGHQPDANSSDESAEVDEHKQMKDLITFSDSEDSDSYVSRWVSGVISKQLVNLQEEIFGKRKQHQCKDSIIDIDGSSVDPVFTTSHTSVLPEIEVCQLKEPAFDIHIGTHTSNDEVDKYPSPDDSYAVIHPAVDDKLLSDVSDSDGKHFAVNGEIEKVFSALNDDGEQNTSIDNSGDGKHPSAVDNDCGRYPSDVRGIAIKHNSAVNVSADIHPDDSGKHHSDVSDDDGKNPVHGVNVLSAVKDERVRNPFTVNGGDGKPLSAVDNDSGKCHSDASDDSGKHSAIDNDFDKVVSTVEDLKTILFSVNAGDTKNSVALEDDASIHPSACNNNAGKCPVLDDADKTSAVNDDAGNHPNPGKLPLAVDDAGKHPSAHDNDATDNTGKHSSSPDGDAHKHPSDIDDARKHPSAVNIDEGKLITDNDCLDISFLDVKTNKMSWFELTEHEDEFDLFPVQTGFPKKAPENMTLSVSQATVEEVQCDQAESQLESSKPSFDIQDSNMMHCQQDQNFGTIEEREGEFDDLPELECLITAPGFVPEVYDNVPKLDIAVDSNDGTPTIWTSDEPPPLIELVEDGPPPLLENAYL